MTDQPGATEQRLTGTDDRPIERIPDEVRTRKEWFALLAGPTIWISHFMVVYLAAETACTPTDPDQWSFLSEDAVTWLTVLATAGAAAACTAVAVFAWRRLTDHDPHGAGHWVFDLARTGFFSAIGALIGVLAVGAPAVFLSPLC